MSFKNTASDNTTSKNTASAQKIADPVDKQSSPDSTWTTTNLAEAVPGVLTPLGWSIWGDACERALRGAFQAMGVLSKSDAQVPERDEDRCISIFHGRAAAQADFLCAMGDRLPGTDGTAIAEQVFNAIPAAYVPAPTRRYYPSIALHLPVTMARAPRAVKRSRAETETWWHNEIDAMASRDMATAQEALVEAASRFDHNMKLQALAVLTVTQPVYDQLTTLLEGSGDLAESLMAGYGSHEETHMVDDLWACSRGDLNLAQFVRRHGYHGIRDGEVSGVSWREDTGPLETILAGYRDLDASANPALKAAEKAKARDEAERLLLQSLPLHKRASARLTFTLARRYIPLRGVGKVAFLQSLDVARCAARHIGQLLVEDGVIDDVEDIFFLTVSEVAAGDWDSARELITGRRTNNAAHTAVTIPTLWQGAPTTEPVDLGDGAAIAADDDDSLPTLHGVAASPGRVEGFVRVVVDPGESPMEPGEILVTHTTDPSWATVIYLAGALVIDIGGLLSHASVISRELGVPCVAGVGDATTKLRTGDWCRVDGSAGTVEVLRRA